MDASERPHRLQGALFQSIGDEGRAALVERRLFEAIAGGHLRAGDRLPSESDLARTFGVASVTVREALLSLRARGLLVTKRGRNGGSFVADDADPLTYARETIAGSSRLALRDLVAHYSAITIACVALAARRADPSELHLIRARLDRLDDDDLEQWRRTMDDVMLEIVALSQSARLTREQMRLQAELSPLLRLFDSATPMREAQRRYLESLLDAMEAGDEAAATTRTARMADKLVEELIVMQSKAD